MGSTRKRPRLIAFRIGWFVAVLLLVSLVLVYTPQYIEAFKSVSFHSILASELLKNHLLEIGVSEAGYSVFNSIRILLLVLCFFSVGGIIFWRRSEELVSLFFSLLLIAMGVIFAFELLPPPVQPPTWMSFITNLVFCAFFFSFYFFPDGRFVPRWTRWLVVVWMCQVVMVTFFAGTRLDPNTWPALLSGLLYLVSFLSIPFSQTYRYRKVSNFEQRQQTKWVVFGLGGAVLSFLLFWMPINVLPGIMIEGRSAVLYDLIGGTLLLAGYSLVPLSIGFALLRYRLWEIDPLLNRTLVYGILTASVILVYILIVGYLGTLIGMGGNLVISLLATGVVAIIFQPLREFLQQAINRLMYGERDNPYKVISSLGQRLEATLNPNEVLDTIVVTVKEALKLPYVSIELYQNNAVIERTSAGVQSLDVINLPLVYHNEMVGELILAPRSPGEGFNPADRNLLEDLARQAGVAAHVVRLTTELQHAREHLVLAREEERRRLRHDLHDDLGPYLASQTLTITAARQLLHEDPIAADRLLAEAVKHAQVAIEDIRRVVNDLRPPALDDLGLIGALRSHAESLEQGGLQVTVRDPQMLPTLPAGVEVACYRIAKEALANVIHHAQAKHCTIDVTANKEYLQLEVRDDGIGIALDHRDGVGLNSMRARAEELGGTLQIESSAHKGTKVLALLPLAGEV